MQEHPPQDSGGYGRRLKKKESFKGFTLVELIVVIVILAILAAILIPGLLKWIDQAKDKKYELEAREIALAAQAAAAKVYAQGVEVDERQDGPMYNNPDGVDPITNCDIMGLDTFAQEIRKLTGANIKAINLYAPTWNYSDDSRSRRPWGGSVNGFDIYFVSSDGVNIKACWRDAQTAYPTDGWVIYKKPGYWPFV